MALFTLEGLNFLFRWMHFFFGIIWIGHLYYFNFTQGAFLKEKEVEPDTQTRSKVTRFLLPRALWWFRYGALFTFLTGVAMLGLLHARMGAGAFETQQGVMILVGAAFGTMMFLNVWLVIWPAQQVVIASAQQVASGGQAIAEAPAKAAKALLGSRTNVAFSLPMLFFMGAGKNLVIARDSGMGLAAMYAAVFAIIALLEGNLLFGKMRKPLESVVAVIHTGVILTALTYGLVEVLY
jgi:uncharacterized membrane protein